MNRDHLKKNIGYRVRLRPAMCELDQYGRALPRQDDDWLIQRADDDALHIQNLRTWHVYAMGFDHVHHFMSDRDRMRDGLNRGVLVLVAQLFLRDNRLDIEPTVRPGEAVARPCAPLLDKLVDIRYPVDSGLVANHNRRGYQLMWAQKHLVPRRIEFEGWERVTVKGVRGRLIQYRAPSPQGELVLLRRFVPQPQPIPYYPADERYFS